MLIIPVGSVISGITGMVRCSNRKGALRELKQEGRRRGPWQAKNAR